jgi:hypothetical protein
VLREGWQRKSFMFFNLNLFQVKKHKDCSEHPDPKLPGGTTKQFAGSRRENTSQKKRTLNPLYILSKIFMITPEY